MLKIFKIIYVYLLDTLDLNKIMVTDNKGVKSEAQTRLVITAVIALIYGYAIYKLCGSLIIDDFNYVFGIGMIFSTILCLFINFKPIKEQVLFNKDRELLAVMPISNNQILFSKLFFVYLKDLLYVGIVMLSILISYMQIKSVDETFGLVFLIDLLMVPLIPIILTTVLIIGGYYLRKKIGKILYGLVKIVSIVGIVFLLYLYTKDITGLQSMEMIIKTIFNRLSIIYPLALFFKNSLELNYLALGIYVLLSIIFVYLYFIVLAGSYDKLSFDEKEKKKRVNTNYKYGKKLKIFSLLNKEFKQIFLNKSIRNKMVILPYVFCFGICMLSLYIRSFDYSNYMKYFNFFVPIVFSANVGLIMVSLTSISLEKDNLKYMMSLPISKFKLFFSKILVNVLLGMPIIMINYLIVRYIVPLEVFERVISLIMPLCFLIFISLLSLIIDLKYPCIDIERLETRLVNIIPSFIIIFLFISGLVLFYSPYIRKDIYLLTYIVIIVFFILVEIGYLIVFSRKCLKRLFN